MGLFTYLLYLLFSFRFWLKEDTKNKQMSLVFCHEIAYVSVNYYVVVLAWNVGRNDK